MEQTEITHESKYEVWHQIDSFQIKVYVIELNPGEIIRRKVLDLPPGRFDDRDPNRPWPLKRNEKLILRYWNCGTARTRGYGVAQIFRFAEELRRALESGLKIDPSYTLEGRLANGYKRKRRTKRQEKNDQRANSAHDE